MPDFSIYVNQEVLILLPALWFITYLLKRTPQVPVWIIPWVMVILGIAGASSILGGFRGYTIYQGVIVAAINVLGNSLIQDTVGGLTKGNGSSGYGKGEETK